MTFVVAGAGAGERSRAAGLRRRASMRAIVVGGRSLRPDLYRDGAGPRLAGSAELRDDGMLLPGGDRDGASPELRLLSHVEVRTDEDGCLAIASGALLTGYAASGWRGSPTRKSMDGSRRRTSAKCGRGSLRVGGRRGAFVKIGGESVDLSRLDAVLERVMREQAAASGRGRRPRQQARPCHPTRCHGGR